MNTLGLLFFVGFCTTLIAAAPTETQLKTNPVIEKLIKQAAEAHQKIHDSALVGIAKQKLDEALNKMAENPLVIQGSQKAAALLQTASETDVGGKIAETADPFVKAAVKAGCILAKNEGITTVSKQCELAIQQQANAEVKPAEKPEEKKE